MEKDIVTKEYIRKNILTISEACEFLGVTRQMLNNYVNQGRLKPLKQLSNGLIFYRADLMDFSERKYNERRVFNMKPERIIYGPGNTQETLKCFAKEVTDFDAVVSVRLYFEERDAIEDGYFQISGYNQMGKLIPVRGPHCIIKLNNGDEKWFGGVNCGYDGAGPNGSVSILKKIGVEDDLTKKVYDAAVIEYYLDDNKWDCEVIRSRYDSDGTIFDISKNLSDYFVYNNDLILCFCDRSNMFRVCDQAPGDFVELNQAFIQRPVTAEILSKDYALDTGHYVISFGKEIVFQIVLKDMSGKQIWLPCVLKENIPIARQDNIKQILEKFGIEISTKDFVKEELKYWLNIQPRIENRTIYSKG